MYFLFKVLIQALLSCSADLVVLQSLFERLLVLVGEGSLVDGAAVDIKNEFVSVAQLHQPAGGGLSPAHRWVA